MPRKPASTAASTNYALAIFRETVVSSLRRLHETFSRTAFSDYFQRIFEVARSDARSVAFGGDNSDLILVDIFQARMPDFIVIDNRTAFTTSTFTEFLKRKRVRDVRIPPYHPISNGPAERVVQTTKENTNKASLGDYQTKISRVLFLVPHDTQCDYWAHVCQNADGDKSKGRSGFAAYRLPGSDYTNSCNRSNETTKRHDDRIWAKNCQSGPSRIQGSVALNKRIIFKVVLENETRWHHHEDHQLRATPSVTQEIPNTIFLETPLLPNSP